MKCNSAKTYDCIIIGGGPAGITAAIYLARRNLCILLLYNELGGQASITADIENYSGFRMISGPEFTKRLHEHIQHYDITCFNEEVLSVSREKGKFNVQTRGGKYSARTLIIASGARQRMLDIKGEKEYLNRGVAYCATCDAPLFKNKKVIVVGGGNSALGAALQLEKYAKKVYLITRNPNLQGEQLLIDKVKSSKNIEIMKNIEIKEIIGNKFVEAIIVRIKNKKKKIEADGIFIEIGYTPNSEFIDLEKNQLGEIVIDRNNETSVPGIFAAGDVTDVQVKQIIVAAGEGAKAALSVAEHLEMI